MAVTASPKETVLIVSYQTGLTPAGSPIIRQRSFPNIRSEAIDQDVYDVAVALYGLQNYPIISVRRDNRVDLAE